MLVTLSLQFFSILQISRIASLHFNLVQAFSIRLFLDEYLTNKCSWDCYRDETRQNVTQVKVISVISEDRINSGQFSLRANESLVFFPQ